ncbi:MAG: hypothetical protein Q4G52_04275 [Clostridia bacterium]|nr:hypothetical protein [Clostridia bacterium]
MNASALRPLKTAGSALIALLVALYCAIVLLLSIRAILSPLVFAMIVAAFFALIAWGARLLYGAGLRIPAQPDKLAPRAFCFGAGLCLLSMLCYWVAYYPGGVSSDTLMQWEQAHQLRFDDWHPALHSMILCLLIHIVDHPAFVLLVQMAAYAAAVGYVTAVLRRWRFPRPLCVLTAAYLSLSPAICNTMTFIWKDCAFAICALLLGTQMLEIHLSQGMWLRRRAHLAALALTLALTSIMRHNGPAMTLPAVVWLFVSFPKAFKRIFTVSLAALLLVLGIKGPLYSALSVQRSQASLSETFGVPMVILSHIFAEAPNALDEETVAFLTRFAPQETFAQLDACGDWNEIKWYVSSPDLSDKTLSQVSAMALRAAAKEPQLALDALAGLWQLPLLPFGEAYWRLSPYTSQEFVFSFRYEPGGFAPLQYLLGGLCRLFSKPALSWLSWCPGFALLTVMLACALLSQGRPASALLLPAMLIAYDLATALVLSSPTDFRFFLSTPMLAPLCVFGLLARRTAGR